MTIAPEDFVKRLNDLFVYKATPYGRIKIIYEEQEKHANALMQFKGFHALSDGFKCFFLETVELINIECRPKVTIPLSALYALFIQRLAHAFQSMCAAEGLALRGYPMQAYTLLRNTFDNILLTSAAVQKVADFYAIEGVDANKTGQAFDERASRILRKRTEREVRLVMTGANSGLNETTVAWLAKWDALFDFETHGARLSLAQAQGYLRQTEPLRIVPQYNEEAWALFLNRYVEVGWMILRPIPLAQPAEVPLQGAWRDKWKVLDDSFEQSVYALTKQFGKEIGAAMADFTKTKFPFNASSVFPL